MVGQLRPGTRGIAPVARKKGALPRVDPLPAGAEGPAEAQKVAAAPARIVQFHAQLGIVPEPRMTLSEAGNLKLLEAVTNWGTRL